MHLIYTLDIIPEILPDCPMGKKSRMKPLGEMALAAAARYLNEGSCHLVRRPKNAVDSLGKWMSMKIKMVNMLMFIYVHIYIYIICMHIDIQLLSIWFDDLSPKYPRHVYEIRL